MKKLLSSLMCAGLVITGSMTSASAASGINAEEQRLLDYLTQTGMSIAGEKEVLNENDELYKEVYNILNADSVDLTASEVDTVKNAAKNVQDYLDGMLSTQELTTDMIAELVRLSSPALAVLDLKMSYNAKTDTLILMDANGQVLNTVTGIVGSTKEDLANKVPSDNIKLEKTGEDFSSTYVIVGGLTLVLAVAGLLTFKKREQVL